MNISDLQARLVTFYESNKPIAFGMAAMPFLCTDPFFTKISIP